MTIGMPSKRRSDRAFRTISMPFMFGMLRSITTTSGCISRASCTASRPPAHEPIRGLPQVAIVDSRPDASPHPHVETRRGLVCGVRAVVILLIALTLAIGAAVPAAVWARVVVETAKDPTSHNLWPFEIAIAMVVGMACALIGAIAGGVIELRSRPAEVWSAPGDMSDKVEGPKA